MSVALQDDSICLSSGSQKYEDDKRVRKCGCQEGFYIHAVDALFCDSVTKCLACPIGITCGFQQDFTEAVVLKNYYRHANTSLSVVECPIPNVCIGNSTAGDALCSEGHRGPFCMICEISSIDRYVWSGGKCEKCSPTSKASMYAIFALLGLLCVGSVLFIARAKKKKKNKRETGEKQARFSTERLEAFADKFQTKYKILITFTQILTKITTLYPIGHASPTS